MEKIYIKIFIYIWLGIMIPVFSFSQTCLPEKILLHTDRTTYLAGETIWLKGSIVDAWFYLPLAFSSAVYIELLDAAYIPVYQGIIGVNNSIAAGHIDLPSGLKSGNYVIRAYTSWMKNGPSDNVFTSCIRIINTEIITELVKPVKEDLADVIFSPESGHFIYGARNRIVFRVHNALADPINLQGLLMTTNGDTIISVVTAFPGIGYFDLIPEPDVAYQLLIHAGKYKGQVVPINLLPEEGYCLRIRNESDGNVDLWIDGNNSTFKPSDYSVLGHHLGFTSFRRNVIPDSLPYHIIIPGDSLLSGINQISLLNSDNQFVCGRIIYNEPENHVKISLSQSKEQYQNREKVTLKVRTTDKYLQPVAANLTVSVVKAPAVTGSYHNNQSRYLSSIYMGHFPDEMKIPDCPTDTDYLHCLDLYMITLSATPVNQSGNDMPGRLVQYPPEHMGTLILGEVIDKNSGQGVPNCLVYATPVGDKVQLYHDETSSTGIFHISVPGHHLQNEFIFSTNYENSDVAIRLKNQFMNGSDQIDAGLLDPADLDEDLLRRYMITQQVRKAYGLSQKVLKPRIDADTLPFYGSADFTMYLGDYIRLPVMEEYFTELVKPVVLLRKKGEIKLVVISSFTNKIIGESPLIIVNGLPVLSSKQVLDLDPKKIDRIEVVQSKYFYKDLVFDGIIQLFGKTIQVEELGLTSILQQEIATMQSEAQFYAPDYLFEKLRMSTLPDYRNTLYWNPEVITDGNGNGEISFYTSDESGSYQICIEGFGYDGLFGKITNDIQVIETINK